MCFYSPGLLFNGDSTRNWKINPNDQISLCTLHLSLCLWRGGGFGTNFQLLMLSLNLLKSKIPYVSGGGVGVWNQLPTFDPESKSAKIHKSLCKWGGGGGGRADYVRHLVRIWGGLQNFDKEFSTKPERVHHSFRAETNKSVSACLRSLHLKHRRTPARYGLNGSLLWGIYLSVCTRLINVESVCSSILFHVLSIKHRANVTNIALVFSEISASLYLTLLILL